MGNSYYDWDTSWTALEDGSGAITARAVADNGVLVSNAVSLDTKAAMEVSVSVVEDNTGAVDGDFYVYVLRDVDGTNYQLLTSLAVNDGPAIGCIIDVVQNATRRKVFTVDAGEVSNCKIGMVNDSGQELAVTVKYRYAVLSTP